MEREAEILLVYPGEFLPEHLHNYSTFIKGRNPEMNAEKCNWSDAHRGGRK